VKLEAATVQTAAAPEVRLDVGHVRLDTYSAVDDSEMLADAELPFEVAVTVAV